MFLLLGCCLWKGRNEEFSEIIHCRISWVRVTRGALFVVECAPVSVSMIYDPHSHWNCGPKQTAARTNPWGETPNRRDSYPHLLYLFYSINTIQSKHLTKGCWKYEWIQTKNLLALSSCQILWNINTMNTGGYSAGSCINWIRGLICDLNVQNIIEFVL